MASPEPSTLEKKCTQIYQTNAFFVEGEKDCNRLFFQCPFARTIWAIQGKTSVDAIYEMSF